MKVEEKETMIFGMAMATVATWLYGAWLGTSMILIVIVLHYVMKEDTN